MLVLGGTRVLILQLSEGIITKFIMPVTYISILREMLTLKEEQDLNTIV